MHNKMTDNFVGIDDNKIKNILFQLVYIIKKAEEAAITSTQSLNIH